MPKKDSVSGETPVVPEAPKAKRMHVVEGRIPREIVRTFYDPKKDCVFDVLLIEKQVVNRRGEERTVTLNRVARCRDEAIQAKYKRNTDNINIEVEEVK